MQHLVPRTFLITNLIILTHGLHGVKFTHLNAGRFGRCKLQLPKEASFKYLRQRSTGIRRPVRWVTPAFFETAVPNRFGRLNIPNRVKSNRKAHKRKHCSLPLFGPCGQGFSSTQSLMTRLGGSNRLFCRVLLWPFKFFIANLETLI